MIPSTQKTVSVGLVTIIALLGLTVMAIPAAATTSTLNGDNTDSVSDFNATSTDHLEYTLNSDDGTNGFGSSGDNSQTLYFNVTYNGEEHVRVSNSSFSGSSTSHTFNISHEDLNTIPGDANETTNVTMNAWGEGSDGSVNTSVDTFHVDITFHEGYAVVYVGDTEAAGDNTDVSTTADSPEGLFSFAQDPTYSVDADNVGLGDNASGTTIHVVAANQSDSDAFSEANDKLWGSYSAEDYHKGHLVQIEGHTHAVFSEEAPTDNLADGYTYATVGERGGHDAYAIHVDEDYDGESSVDISATANDGPTFDLLVKRDAYGGYINAVSASTAPALGGGGGLVAG